MKIDLKKVGWITLLVIVIVSYLHNGAVKRNCAWIAYGDRWEKGNVTERADDRYFACLRVKLGNY